MVTTAFLLLTVSTLAAQINAVLTNNLNDPCEGKSQCFEKPADYPQEMMDRLVAQSDLNHLHRIKRETQLAFENNIESTTNECVEKIETGPVYTAKDSNNISRNVVQSVLFSQTISKITCKTNKICFESLRIGRFECKPTITRLTLAMVNGEGTKAEPHGTDVVTGCRCLPRIEPVVSE